MPSSASARTSAAAPLTLRRSSRRNHPSLEPRTPARPEWEASTLTPTERGTSGDTPFRPTCRRMWSRATTPADASRTATSSRRPYSRSWTSWAARTPHGTPPSRTSRTTRRPCPAPGKERCPSRERRPASAKSQATTSACTDIVTKPVSSQDWTTWPPTMPHACSTSHPSPLTLTSPSAIRFPHHGARELCDPRWLRC